MKALFSLFAIVAVISCSGPQPIGDPWQGMTPAEYVDQMWAEPEKEIPDGLNRSQEKALMDFFQMIAPLAWLLFAHIIGRGGAYLKRSNLDD